MKSYSKFTRIEAIFVLISLAASARADTVLWSFDTPGKVPPGWKNGWNVNNPSCNDNQNQFSCDRQHKEWRVEGGQLRAPIYEEFTENDQGFRDVMDTYTLSPVFKSVAAAGSDLATRANLPVLTIRIPYNESQLGGNGNSVIIGLNEVGTTVYDEFFDLSLAFAGGWTERDAADGAFDGVITEKRELAPNTSYRLRFRAYDFSFDPGPFLAFGIDDISLTNGVIVPLAGDFNEDGCVDAADYVVWRHRGGTEEEYKAWKANFGAGQATGAGPLGVRAVPEAGGFSALAAAALAASPYRPRRARRAPRNH